VELKKVNEILIGLSSTDWAERTDSLQKLTELRDREEVLFLFKRIWRDKDTAHVFAFLQLMENLLEEKDVCLVGLSLFCLSHFREYENIKVKAESNKLLGNFLESPTIYRFVKVAAFRNCWEIAPMGIKEFLTKTIGERNYFELVPLILTNFQHLNRELITLTIGVIKKLEDPRGVRFLKEIARETEDLLIINLCLDGLERIGNFFDGFFYKQYLEHDDKKIRQTAIKGIASLLQQYSLSYLRKTYLNCASLDTKLDVINSVGKVQHKRAGTFLISLYEQEKDEELITKLEWALQSLDKRLVVDPLIELFTKSSDKIRFRILTFFGEIYHEKCFRLLKNVINGNYNEFITVSALDSIAIYDNMEMAKDIEKIALSPENPLSYYALISLYHHDSYDHEGLITKFINLDTDLEHPGHQILLNVIRGKKISKQNRKRLENYVEKTLSSEVSNNAYLAIECAATIFNKAIFKRLIYISHQTKNKFIAKTCVETLIKILGRDPNMLEASPDILLDDRILEHFNPVRMKRDFLFTLLRIIEDVGWDHYKPFVDKFGRYIAENVKTYLVSWDTIEELSMMLELLNRVDFEASYEIVEYLVEDIYHHSNASNQFLILNIVTEFNHPDFLDFVINESLKGQKFGDVGYDLVQRFVDGIV